MTTVSTTATVGPDGMLHVPVPDATPGREYTVTAQAKPALGDVDALGWPVGWHDRMYGCITDETFVAPPRQRPTEQA